MYIEQCCTMTTNWEEILFVYRIQKSLKGALNYGCQSARKCKTPLDTLCPSSDIWADLSTERKTAGELMLGFCYCLFSIIEGFVGHIMVDPFCCIHFDTYTIQIEIYYCILNEFKCHLKIGIFCSSAKLIHSPFQSVLLVICKIVAIYLELLFCAFHPCFDAFVVAPQCKWN